MIFLTYIFLYFQVYNLYPRFFRWLRNRKEFHRLFDLNIKQHSELFRRLKKTLDPQKPRGLVDAFFIHKQNLEVGTHSNRYYRRGKGNDVSFILFMCTFFSATNNQLKNTTASITPGIKMCFCANLFFLNVLKMHDPIF